MAASGPAVAERRGRALHGAAVVDGLRGEKEGAHRGREGAERERRRDAVDFFEFGAGVLSFGVRDIVYVYVHLCVCVCVSACMHTFLFNGVYYFWS